jgi:hypothetical protein
MPKSYTYQRKAHRDDPVVMALANFCEDLDGAQYILENDNGGCARDQVDRALSLLKSSLPSAGINDLTVSINELGRLGFYIDYADDLGEIRITYTARVPR